MIERGIDLWTNPDDIVLDPFAGIGSVPYQAITMGRRGIGVELKESYFKLMENNMASAEDSFRENGADPTVLLRCPKCGIKMPDGLQTCPICGTEVDK